MKSANTDIIKTIKKGIKKNNFFAFLTLLVVIVLTYSALPSTFYQQDEWLGLGQILEQGKSHPIYGLNFFQILSGDARPLTRLFGYLFFSRFPFNFYVLSFYVLAFHLANSFLVYLIARKFFKGSALPLLASLFFAISSVSHQSVSWFGAAFGLQPGSFLILLSIYLFIHFLDSNKKIYAIFSVGCAILSLYFKESGIFLFLFLPILPIILKKRVQLKKYLLLISPLLIYSFAFSFYRIILMLGRSSGDILAGSTFLAISEPQPFLVTLIVRIIMYPLTSFSLLFINPSIPREIAIWFIRTYYPFIQFQGDLVAYTVVLDMLAVVASICLIFFILKFIKSKPERVLLFFSVSLIFFSIVPYVLVSKQYTYLEPRYYYIPIAGASILLTLMFSKLYQRLARNSYSAISIFVFLLLYFYLHVSTIRSDISIQKKIAQERIGYLSQLKKLLPTLTDNRNIFYVMGDKYHVVEGNYTPFQNGFGYTLMVIYHGSGKMPPGLLSSGYFFNFEQGYKEVGGKGFGYYMDFSKLKKDVQQQRLSATIHAYYYDSEKKILIDRSNDIRKKLSE